MVAITQGRSPEIWEADAQLIAASPELLEALQKTQAIIGPITLDTFTENLPEIVERYSENQKLIERILADRQ